MEEVRKERVLQGRELTPLEGSRGRRDLGVRVFFSFADRDLIFRATNGLAQLISIMGG